jgi:putative redox protein
MKTISVQGSMANGFAIDMACGNHHVFIDQPRAAFGTDTGPSPLELILAALGGCFGTIARFLAHQRKIELRGMRFEIEADYDPAGLLGRDKTVRPGFQDVRVLVDIDADLSHEEKLEFMQEVERRCPLADNLLNGTRLHTELAV